MSSSANLISSVKRKLDDADNDAAADASNGADASKRLISSAPSDALAPVLPQQPAMSLAEIAGENAAADAQVLSLFDVERLTRKHTHALRCTFDSGALQQRVFACVHCMRRTPDAAPFGVCEACFDVCHRACGARDNDPSHVARDNVDFYAIERKRDFRCDCGTAAAPPDAPCLWKRPTKFQGRWSVPEHAIAAARARERLVRAWRNDANRYGQNFRGLYCWCAKPWSSDTEELVSMIQCELCLEWYHDERCLVPADNRYVGKPPHALVCRSCLPRHPLLHPYIALASDIRPPRDDDDAAEDESDDVAAIEEQQLQAALVASMGGDAAATDLPTPPPPPPQACRRPPPLGDGPRVRTDVNLFANFAAMLCECEACDAALQAAGLHFLVEEEPTDDVCEDTVVPEDVPLAQMFDSATGGLSFEQRHLASAMLSDFRAALGAVVAQKEHGAELTEADIEQFKRNMEAARQARRGQQ